jgi:hypothetical protein
MKNPGKPTITEHPLSTRQPHLIGGAISTISIGDHTITMDIARQLDVWSHDRAADFQALARINTCTEEWSRGVELIGTDKRTGALVRLFIRTEPLLRLVGDPGPFTENEELAASFADYPKAVLPEGAW